MQINTLRKPHKPHKTPITIANAIKEGYDYIKYSYNHLLTPLIQSCIQQGRQLKFHWIRGHSTFTPNITADRLAKSVSSPTAQFSSTSCRCKRCNSCLIYGSINICLDNCNLTDLTERLIQFKAITNFI